MGMLKTLIKVAAAPVYVPYVPYKITEVTGDAAIHEGSTCVTARSRGEEAGSNRVVCVTRQSQYGSTEMPQ